MNMHSLDRLIKAHKSFGSPFYELRLHRRARNPRYVIPSSTLSPLFFHTRSAFHLKSSFRVLRSLKKGKSIAIIKRFLNGLTKK